MRAWMLMCMIVAVLALVGCKDDKGDEVKEGKGGQSKAALQGKTVEAIDNLDRIYKGAADYFMTPRVSQMGEPVPCQFPATTEFTPGKNCNDKAVDDDEDGSCDANPSAWDNATWAALRFEITDPHYYVYSFNSAGELAEATFTISAFGDLDGDGVMSTFQRTGKAASADGFCDLTRGAVMSVKDELE